MKDEVIASVHIARWRIWAGVISALISIPLVMWILSRGENLRFGIVMGLCSYCIVTIIDEVILFLYKDKKYRKQS